MVNALSTALRRLRGLGLGLALAAALAACKHPEPPRGPLGEDQARAKIEALEKRLAKKPDDIDALRDLAHLRWLHLGDVKAALPILDRLVERGDLVAIASRMVIAEARLDRARSRALAEALIERAAKYPPEAAVRPLAMALAEAAARRLDGEHGALADDDEAFIAFFDRLDRKGLPVEVTRPLLSQRASIARRLDDPAYRSYYDAEGCVRAWEVGPVEGTLGELELRTPPKGPLKVDPEAVLTELSCVVRLWNPAPRAGVRRLGTTLEVPGERLRIELAGQQPLRAYLDGQEIHRSDRDDRYPARRVLLDLEVTPGPHRLEVHLAMPRDKAWVLARATDHAGRPVPVKPAPVAVKAPFTGAAKVVVAPLEGDPPGLDPQVYGPWIRYFAALDALADGDSDRAERFADQLEVYGPRFPEAHALLARVAAEDPSRERTASAARERQELELALEQSVDLEAARVRLLDLSLSRGEVAEVLEAIGERPKGSLEHLDGDLLRFRTYLARGSESLAEAALEDAARRNPRSCEVLKHQRQLAQQRGEVAREDALVAASEHCAGTLTVRAGLAERRGRHAEALDLLRKSLERTPDDTDLLQALAVVATAAGRYDEAKTAHDRLLRLNPYSPRSRVAVADLLAQAGEDAAARENVGEAVTRIPSSSALHEIASHLGLADDIEALRVDGAPIVAAYVAGDALYPGASEVLVLDRSAARIYEDGSVRQIVHTIAEVRTKEAIDRYGEIQVPEGASLLTLHSIKPDGRVVDPESIAGKAGLSLRGLEIGDFVEYEIIVDQEPQGYLPGYVDLSTFRFQSYDVPFHVSEMVVMHPAATPIKVDVRGGAPAALREERGDLVLQTWRVERSPRLGVEPNPRDLLDEVPSVRVYTPLDLRAWLDTLSLRIIHAQRQNPELARLARTIAQKARKPAADDAKAKEKRRRRRKLDELERRQPAPKGQSRAQLHALWRWVVENVEDAGDISTPATLTLSARQGNRLMLLRAFLQELGFRSEIWIARDRFGPSLLKDGHPMPETYEAPILMVWLDGAAEPIPVLTNSKVVPLGYLPANLIGADALRLHLADHEPEAGPVKMPTIPASLADHRRYDLEIELDANGDGVIQGTIALQGMEAIAWREALRTLDRDRREEAFERAELAILAQGAALDLASLEIDNEKALSKPLILRFTAGARGLGIRQGADLVIRSALVPMNLGLGFTGLPERRQGMKIAYAPVQESVVKLSFLGAKVQALPEAIKESGELGGYTRAVDGGRGDETITIRTRSRLRPGIVDPDGYGELRELTRVIRAAEDEVIRAR
ncbi:MAG: tetratricopeptide repeat protein [Myxococcales bacterium]|nr:tetratricopeptide repeat protein [Myxococcales bacterium]